MASTNIDDTGHQRSSRQLDIELLALDFEVCPRCGGTQHNLEQALALLQPVLSILDYRVQVVRRLIQTEEEAREVGLVSSPTIRINGHDMMPIIQESHCEACAGLCGTEEETLCRVWHYQGQEYPEAPVPLLVDAILSTLYGARSPVAASSAPPSQLPVNLARFFRRRAVKSQSCCAVEGLPGRDTRASAGEHCCEQTDERD